MLTQTIQLMQEFQIPEKNNQKKKSQQHVK